MVTPLAPVLRPASFTGLLSTMLLVLMGSIVWIQPMLKANAQPLQTEITQQDLALIECLVQLALDSSADIRAAKVAVGTSAFEDTMTLEVGPDYRTGS